MDHFEPFGIQIGQGKYHEEAVYGVALVYTAMFNAISTLLDEYGLTPAKLNVLMIIKHRGKDKGLSQIEIGNRLMVTASNMTRVLEKLQGEGLISRSALEGDRRVKVIKITSKGSKVLDQVWPSYQAKLRELADHLPLKQQQELVGLLQDWLKG